MKKFSHGCTLDCFDCCKFNVYNNNGTLKIEGDKNHPYTNGFICEKGLSHLKRLNHKDRIYTPLLKINGKFKEISFERALDIMAERLRYYKKNFSSKSILHYDQFGSGSSLKSIADIFFNFYGGVNKADGGPCWSAGMRATKYDFGDAKSHSLSDMLNSKSIFLWGKNPANTSIHTLNIIKKAKEKNIPIIVIDPIFSETAKLADKYIKIIPGTDGALALAMAKIIIKNNAYNKDFIEKHVIGFNEFKNYLNTLSLDYLCEECGVSLEEIINITNIYINKFSTILIGYGVQKYINGGNSIRCINALGAITGQIGKSGGGINYANKVFTRILNLDPYNSEHFATNNFFQVSKISNFINKCNSLNLKEEGIFEAQTVVHDSIANENNLYKTPIKMAVITKSNLLNQLPDINSLKKAFKTIEFKVCFDMFLTDTASICDLFIPCTNTLESEDILFSSMSNPYIIYNEKVTEPKHRLMDEYNFFMELAKIMNIKTYPKVSKKEYLKKIIEPLTHSNKNITLDYLKDNCFTLHKDVAWEDLSFKTPSKKYELFSSLAKDECGHPLPTYLKSKNHPKNLLRLITVHAKDSLSSQHFIDKGGICEFFINENTCKEFNITNKEIVILKTKNGKIKAKALIDNGIPNNVIKIYVGWWEKHGNPNILTSSNISDIGGQITYNDSFVEIKKE